MPYNSKSDASIDEVVLLWLLRVLVGLFVLASVAILFVNWPMLVWGFIYQENSTTNSDILRNIFLGVAAVFGSAFGVYQLYNASRRTRIMSSEARTSITSELNARYAKSVELLESETETVRVGAISALEKLSTEQNGEFSKLVISVLQSYVKEHSK
jgi:hypothetical protein